MVTITLLYCTSHTFFFRLYLFERRDYSKAWGALEEQARLKFPPTSHSFSLSRTHTFRFMQPRNVLPSSRSGNAFRLEVRVRGKLLLRGQLRALHCATSPQRVIGRRCYISR